ncbi:MAG: ATP phosphoribosyltransferase regulatory subunit, partial [Pseudomonadota bacterium]|nr:ATP phosphoribosyltransferase regulatory subunit [Pseudomonadota bacterium]
IIDLYTSWGYEFVVPPMLEYLESLLVGAGKTVDLQTFKIIDQLSGRLMGIHADMTPQVARIDARRLKRSWPTRLCYLETVLHTRPNNFAGSRSPLQLGAELYGYEGIAADIEIIALMLATLNKMGIPQFHIDVGHVGIYQGLVQQAQLNAAQRKQLADAIKRKASAEIKTLLSQWQLPSALQNQLNALIYLHGDSSILSQAHQQLASASFHVRRALEALEQLQVHFSSVPLYFDLSESRGYSYHTGLVFAAYVPKHGQAIAKGGRYDDLGEAFLGYRRPATGFSANLITLMSLLPAASERVQAIFAPAHTDEALSELINQLRQQGHIVIQGLPQQQGDARTMGCAQEIRFQHNQWQVVELS